MPHPNLFSTNSAQPVAAPSPSQQIIAFFAIIVDHSPLTTLLVNLEPPQQQNVFAVFLTPATSPSEFSRMNAMG